MNSHVFDANLRSRLICSRWDFTSILETAYIVIFLINNPNSEMQIYHNIFFFSLFFWFYLFVCWIFFFSNDQNNNKSLKTKNNIFTFKSSTTTRFFCFDYLIYTRVIKIKKTNKKKYVTSKFDVRRNTKFSYFMRSFCNIFTMHREKKNVRPHPIDSTRELIKIEKWIFFFAIVSA